MTPPDRTTATLPSGTKGVNAARRQAAERFGRSAEFLCRLVLRLKGYRLVSVDRRSALGQIDIVARRGAVLAIVEVKARSRDAATVSPAQRARLERAAAVLIARRPDLAGLGVRFDVMHVRPFGFPAHVRDAWRPGMR